ncbi:hypothetical protein HanHA89_Chr09g0336761 [Helianthus annuus]|nr:hypothetical protein HanHA89_Chr09g0336761 [Helianthus annuus]
MEMGTPAADKGMQEVFGIVLRCIRPLNERPEIKTKKKKTLLTIHKRMGRAKEQYKRWEICCGLALLTLEVVGMSIYPWSNLHITIAITRVLKWPRMSYYMAENVGLRYVGEKWVRGG